MGFYSFSEFILNKFLQGVPAVPSEKDFDSMSSREPRTEYAPQNVRIKLK